MNIITVSLYIIMALPFKFALIGLIVVQSIPLHQNAVHHSGKVWNTEQQDWSLVHTGQHLTNEEVFKLREIRKRKKAL